MANIFSKKDQYIDRVNRSTFDLSFVNNFTTNFGVITPVCLLPVGFGDSVQINAKFNLQLMPTVFPIQTQMYARLHFVYVRTRTIWEDWQKFFGGDETVTPPWIRPVGASHSDYFSMEDLQTSTLADYLGVPTVITGTYGSTSSLDLTTKDSVVKTVSVGTEGASAPLSGYVASSIKTYAELESFINTDAAFDSKFSVRSNINTGYGAYVVSLSDLTENSSLTEHTLIFDFSKLPHFLDILRSVSFGLFSSLSSGASSAFASSYLERNSVLSMSLSGSVLTVSFAKTYTGYFVLFIPDFEDSLLTSYGWYEYVTDESSLKFYRLTSAALSVFSSFTYIHVDVVWNKPEVANCPFYSSSPEVNPAIRLSALPFRVYEAYYNAFGRDVRNNPFMINGKTEYNRYVPSTSGGDDSYKYKLHYANWEPDAYTTALQSPQAGLAPLVGISSLGEATFRDASGTTYSAQLETAEDGDTVTGFQMKSSDAPADVVRNLIGMATSGISISDFRNVNSLQRFLEIRIRQSPRYLNLVKGLFNVNLDYDELMMPEFLGGISDNVPVYKVTQTTPTDGSPLGSFAGQGFIQSGMKHVIRKYCPEEGYILGVLSVVPVANYTQLLMPHWTRMSLLDWHFPQFNNVSFQPMTYKNLCPYQAYVVNPANVNNVFGYQRAWWDLIGSFDEVHGQFRTSLRNFVINRVFDSAPELSQDFLLVDPNHVNDVFATTAENGDKILGSIAFDITKKTTIPRNSIPHIE
jgi:hypothetical protein